MFVDREDAGSRLAERLAGRKFSRGLVVSIPRGGTVVGAAVAKALGLPLEIIIPRKIGAPHNAEFAIGAVAQDGSAVFDEESLRRFNLTPQAIGKMKAEAIVEITRRTHLYRGGKPPGKWIGRSIILVDDGIATGYTVHAALRSLRKAMPKEIILAIPVAPADALQVLSPEVDELVCLLVPELFMAVGQVYSHFEQTSDEEVMRLLEEWGE